MIDREKIINGLNDIGGFIAGRVGFEQARNFLRTIDDTIAMLKEQEDLGTELTNAVELIHKKNERIEKLLKEQEAVQQKTIPEELKLKMWNALYAEEDEYEKKFVGKEEHLNWFTVYRPWLQKGFDIAINAIADWEGR